jgi:putative flavoprotein involved in K+ transport
VPRSACHAGAKGVRLQGWRTERIGVDAVIWCAGFRAYLSHLQGLQLPRRRSALCRGSRSRQHAGLWLMGYGEWTGYASATIIGVQKHAKQAAGEIVDYLN